MPRLPTVARRAATVSDIVTTGMGPSYPRGRPLKRPSRPFLFLTLIPGVRGTRVARRRGPHAVAYVTAVRPSWLTSLEVPYFRRVAALAPSCFVAVSIAATGPYPHIEISDWATFPENPFGSRARIRSIALASCSFAKAGAVSPRVGSWKYCGPTWVKSEDAMT